MKRRETRLPENPSPLPSKVERRSQWMRRRRRRWKGDRPAPSCKRIKRKGAAISQPAWAGSDQARAQAMRKTSGSYCRVNIKKTHKQRTEKRNQNTKQIRGGKRKGYALKRIDTV